MTYDHLTKAVQLRPYWSIAKDHMSSVSPPKHSRGTWAGRTESPRAGRNSCFRNVQKTNSRYLNKIPKKNKKHNLSNTWTLFSGSVNATRPKRSWSAARVVRERCWDPDLFFWLQMVWSIWRVDGWSPMGYILHHQKNGTPRIASGKKCCRCESLKFKQGTCHVAALKQSESLGNVNNTIYNWIPTCQCFMIWYDMCAVCCKLTSDKEIVNVIRASSLCTEDRDHQVRDAVPGFDQRRFRH